MKPMFYYDEVFRQNFYFFHKWDKLKFSEYIKKNYKEDFSEPANNYDGLTIRLRSGQIIVWTNKNKHANGNLIHEITHATNMVLHKANVEPCYRNDELQAYYNAMLYRMATK